MNKLRFILYLTFALSFTRCEPNKQTKTQMAIQVTIQKADGEITAQENYSAHSDWCFEIQRSQYSLSTYEFLTEVKGTYKSMNKTMHFTLTKIED